MLKHLADALGTRSLSVGRATVTDALLDLVALLIQMLLDVRASTAQMLLDLVALLTQLLLVLSSQERVAADPRART